MKKNVGNLVQKVPIETDSPAVNGTDNKKKGHHKRKSSLADNLSARLHLVSETLDNTTVPKMPSRSGMSQKRQVSDSIDLEALMDLSQGVGKGNTQNRDDDAVAKGYSEIRPKTPRLR